MLEIATAGAWILKEGFKLAASVADETEEKTSVSLRGWLSNKISDKISEKLGRDESLTSEPVDEDESAGPHGKGQITVELDREEEAAAERLPEKFAVDLSSALPEDCTGMDAWKVRAYEAALWRLAVLTVWEQRAVAIAGALQGREWMTICVPYQSTGVVKPSDLWRSTRGDVALYRPFGKAKTAEFFVKPCGNTPSDKEISAVNDELSLNGFNTAERPVQPSDLKTWHRIDGLYPMWVGLQPDSETEALVTNAGNEFLPLTRHLSTRPLGYGEYPEEWQAGLLRIDPDHGLPALIDGVDRFAAKSASARTKIEELLKDPDGSSPSAE